MSVTANELVPTGLTIVILGASGDLTKRLLFPAIHRLLATRQIEDDTKIVGYALDDLTTEQFVAQLQAGVDQFGGGIDRSTWEKIRAQTTYRRGDFAPDNISALAKDVNANALFYLALPPATFGPAAVALGEAGLADESAGWRRLVIEKPFGTDTTSAAALQAQLRSHWDEKQLYRIDHFLGKDTVQNMLVFRLANRFVESVWNSASISQVQITAAETLGLEGRWRYYDHAGALRDMLQNHLMQVFALTAMEPPSVWDAEVLRDHKVEVLRSVRAMDAEHVGVSTVRGQYRADDANTVLAYAAEPNIAPTSTTETYAALRLWVDNWRWQGVPFYLRSGKRLASDVTEIALELRPAPTKLFPDEGGPTTNWIVLRLRPDETIEIHAVAKQAGLTMDTEPIVLTATDGAAGGGGEYSAYELLILDAIAGDHSLFIRGDEAEQAWAIVQPVLDAWANPSDTSLALYPSGSEGPEPAPGFFAHGHAWRSLR
jgi:glucose-6-phosphate 1-dehydrogenase